MSYPVDFDFTIIRGDDFIHEFEFQDETCTGITLSGTYHSQIRRNGTVLATFTCTYTGSVLTLALTNTETTALPVLKDIKWDLEHHDTLGNIRTIIGGDVKVVDGVTQI